MPELSDWIPVVVSAFIALVTSLVATATANAHYRDANKSRYVAENQVRRLLKHPKYKMRSFDKIAKRIGGFSDDELRQLLVRAGAIRFYSARREDGKLEEFWGLYRRTRAFLHDNRLEESIALDASSGLAGTPVSSKEGLLSLERNRTSGIPISKPMKRE